MVRVIDLECDIPLTAGDDESSPSAAPAAAGGGASSGDAPEAVPGYGMANYARIFRTRREDAEARPAISAEEAATMLAAAGVERGVLLQASNAITAAAVRAHPERFIGLARMSPHQGMRAVRDLERFIREEGLHGLHLSSFREFLPVSDRRYYPLLTKAAELRIPVRIYSTMSYATDRPYDIGHPRHLDQVCMDFPELTVIAGLAGWPWVNEMVALARRHPNLYIDTSAHRPRYFAQPGSGWEMLMQFGNTLIQDKVMTGLSPALMGEPYETLIQEYLNLPLKDSVKEKWLYTNAARVFSVG